MHTLRTLSTDEYWNFIGHRPDVGYQQTPQWGDVRSGDWHHELVGWFDVTAQLVAVALIRYRNLPGTNRCFAYIAQGPVIDWRSPDVTDQLNALGRHLRSRHAFGVRITPLVSLRSWNAASIKAGITDPKVKHFRDLAPDRIDPVGTELVDTLRAAGWRPAPSDREAGASHPRFNFWLDLQGSDEESVLSGMSKYWRKNIRKAQRAEIEILSGTRADLGEIHILYGETADRNHFAHQPMSYFHSLWGSMGEAFPGSFHLHLARSEGTLVAANASAQVGTRAQGVFATTSTRQPKVKPSNAVYWAVLRQAIADGARLYDLGGVGDGLDEADATSGLVRFKAEMGADAHEYVDAWDLPLEPRIYHTFTKLLPAYFGTTSRFRRAAETIRHTHWHLPRHTPALAANGRVSREEGIPGSAPD